jgi:glycosyltransferase involved in cell wall biosynthesis
LDRDVYHIAILINALAFKWLTFLKIQKTYQRWDKIVTYCKAEADALERELDLRPNHVLPIHGYVDADFFEPSSKQEQAEQPFVLSQGLAKRDYPTLIRAMETLPDVACHISAVSAWDNFKGGYEGMRIPQNVHPIKYDHPSFIRETFEKCEFVVIPLKPDVGMWCAGSTSILQAQAMGKAVVATYLPGLAEYMQDGETGFLVEGNNPAALAEKIDFLWRNPEKAAEMGRRGQEWVTKTFTLDKWMHKISDLITQGERVPAI